MSSSVKTLLVGTLMIFLLSACGGSGSQDQVEGETDNSQSEQPNVPEDTGNSDTQDDAESAGEEEDTPSDTPQAPDGESESSSEGGAQDPEEGTDSAESDTQEEGTPESPDDAPVDEEPTTEPNTPDTQEDAPNNSEPSDEESSTTEPNTPTDSEPSDDTSTDTSDTTTEEEPVAQTLDFSITSGHRSQALDGYIQVSGWAKDFQNSTGGTNLQFQVDLRSSADMFTRTPTISYPSGTLRYEVKPSAEGRVVLSITLKDRDTGIESATKVGTFIVSAAPSQPVVVNKAPSFKNLGNQTVEGDSGAFVLSAWAYDLDDGNEGTQSLSFEVVSNSNPGLFSAPPTVSVPSGTLRFTPKAGESGTAEVSIRLKDDGTPAAFSEITELTLNIESEKINQLSVSPAVINDEGLHEISAIDSSGNKIILLGANVMNQAEYKITEGEPMKVVSGVQVITSGYITIEYDGQSSERYEVRIDPVVKPDRLYVIDERFDTPARYPFVYDDGVVRFKNVVRGGGKIKFSLIKMPSTEVQ